MGIDWQQYLEKQWWEETLLLYTGFMSIDRKRESNAIVGTILAAGEAHKRTKSRLRLQLLAGKALCDLQPSKREPQAVSRLRDTMYRLMDSKIDVKDRFQAGVLAGGLGDTRIHPGNMVRVPAGEFIRGADEYDREKPVRRIYLDEFMMGTYPVTNHEFKAFVDDDGYKNKEYWTEDGWQWLEDENISEPLYWNDREWNGPNFPVVGVSLPLPTLPLYHFPGAQRIAAGAKGSPQIIYLALNTLRVTSCTFVAKIRIAGEGKVKLTKNSISVIITA